MAGDDEDELLRELAKPLAFREKLVASLAMYGPMVLGFAVPPLVVWVSGSREGGWMLAAMASLLVGGYSALWAALSISLFRASGSYPLRDAPPMPIAHALREAAGARIVVEGTVVAGPDGVDDAPLTGRDCVWASASLTVTKPGHRGLVFDRTAERSVARRFSIRDAAGDTLAVEIGGADVTVPGIEQEGIDDGPYAHRLERWLEEESIVLREENGVRGWERALRVGDRVLAFGTVSRGSVYRGEPEPVLSGTPSQQLHITKSTQEELREQHKKSAPIASTLVGALGLAFGLYALARIVIR